MSERTAIYGYSRQTRGARYEKAQKAKQAPSATSLETEAGFQQWVTDLATTLGWRWVHIPDSRRLPGDGRGFPDLLLVRERIIFAECKRQSGKQTWEQTLWEIVLVSAGQEFYCWRPSDRAAIEEVLR